VRAAAGLSAAGNGQRVNTPRLFAALLRIENLNVVAGLKKLQLDNNSITKIEHLEAVPRLEWLGESLL
jgi:hypothetical protein